MGNADRYRDLISAVHRYALTAGFKLMLSDVPAERQFPFIFDFAPADDRSSAEHRGLLFLFVPNEAMLTSDVLAEIFKRIQACTIGGLHAMLFYDDDLRLVRRTLGASGLEAYAKPFTYAYHAGQFSTDWEPASAELTEAAGSATMPLRA